MDSMVFKYKHHYQQQNQPFNRRNNNINQTSNSNSNSNNCSISSHNNNNQNSIFILNTATNNILSNNPQLYYTDLNDNKAVSSSSPSTYNAASSATSSSSSVWSSASSTMCSPAAHALQKLFNCSSGSFKFNPSYYSGIESKTFKSNSEILKKKTKFWKYLEGEDNDKNNQQRGIDDEASASEKSLLAKSFKLKSNWSKSIESDNQSQQELSELLEYSCSLCDNCRCMDCQIGYFDCDNSDDSNSEYSFHLSAYEEDDNEEVDNSDNERQTELKSSTKTFPNCCTKTDDERLQTIRKLEVNFELPLNCTMACCDCKQTNCIKTECCQQCFFENLETPGNEQMNQQNFITTKDH